MVCKAYIAASEDPMTGAGQKLKDFERTIAKHYSSFIKNKFDNCSRQYEIRVCNAKKCLEKTNQDCTLEMIKALLKVDLSEMFAEPTSAG